MNVSLSLITSILVRAKRYRVPITITRKLSLTATQITILFVLQDILENKHEGLNVTKLAEKLDAQVGTISASLIRLEEQKLIRRRIVRTKQRGRQNTVPEIRAQGSKVIASFMKM
jgi:DNA-binding MarR family transcriptional regulator